MKRRPLSRPAYDRAFARELQLHRLERIARGELEPLCEREAYFLWTLRQNGRAAFADFILPLPLLLLEAESVEGEADDGAAPGQPFTPTPEPAIPTP